MLSARIFDFHPFTGAKDADYLLGAATSFFHMIYGFR